MGKFTKLGGEADHLVQDALDIVVEEIKRSIPGLRSVILTGGYGRGEGCVKQINGRQSLINDFDIYVVTQRYVPDAYLEEVASRCSHLVGKGGMAHPEAFEERYSFDRFFHVDIRCLVASRMRLLPPTIRYYEMKRNGALLHGEDTLSLLPDIRTEDLPPAEGLRLIMNRMMLLLMAFDPRFVLEPGYMSDEEGAILTYYVAKSYSTAAEALLLYAGEYAPSYTERAERFREVVSRHHPELHRRLPHLADKVEEFTRYKFSPVAALADPLGEWDICRHALGEVFRSCLETSLATTLPESWIEVNAMLQKKLAGPYFRPYAEQILRRYHLPSLLHWPLARAAQAFLSYRYISSLRHHLGHVHWKALSLTDPGVKILALTPLVLYSIDLEGNQDEAMLRQVLSDLKSLYPVEDRPQWDYVKSCWLKAYRAYYLQRFV